MRDGQTGVGGSQGDVRARLPMGLDPVRQERGERDLGKYWSDQHVLCHSYCAEPLQTLAVTVGDHISLALANIRLRETLRHQVVHDVLTGLFNRRYLEETLEREIYRSRRRCASLCLIMLDLDHFKNFNDTYGHEAGDNLLRTLGKFLSDRVRREDVACRYGGEEFVLILAEASQQIVHQRAEEIRGEFSRLPILHRGQVLENVTLSLGVAMFPDHGATGRDVLRAADDAMYRAKAQGRNRVLVAGPELRRFPPNGPKRDFMEVGVEKLS